MRERERERERERKRERESVCSSGWEEESREGMQADSDKQRNGGGWGSDVCDSPIHLSLPYQDRLPLVLS